MSIQEGTQTAQMLEQMLMGAGGNGENPMTRDRAMIAVYLAGATSHMALGAITRAMHKSAPHDDYRAWLEMDQSLDPASKYQIAERANERYIVTHPELPAEAISAMRNGFHSVRAYYFMKDAFERSEVIHKQSIAVSSSGESLPS